MPWAQGGNVVIENRKMLMRLYAADPETGAGGGGDTQQEAGEDRESGKETSPFDTFLADPKNQAEFDRRVSKALETARAKQQQVVDSAVNEALKLQKMTDEQKASYEQQQAQKRLAEREMELTKRELRLNAIDILADKNLPIELADALSYTNAEECDKSIKSVTKAFEKAVSKAVDAQLRREPPKAGQENTDGQIDVIRAAAGLK